MDKKINSKDFLTKAEFINIDLEIKKRINESFEAQIRSKNESLVEYLKQILDTELKTEYMNFLTENDKRRENTANVTIDMCINLYREKIEIFFKEKYFGKTSEFDHILTEARKLAKNKFKEIFHEENSDSDARYLNKVKLLFDNFLHSIKKIHILIIDSEHD
jgi:hypothetical protein